MPMGMVYMYLLFFFFARRYHIGVGFLLFYLTLKVMLRPRLVSNQQRGLRFFYVYTRAII